MRGALFFLSLLVFEGHSWAANYEVKGIYGEDDRIEIKDADPRAIALSDSIFAMIYKRGLRFHGNGDVRIDMSPLSSVGNVCRSQAFASQPTAAECTAFLVGEDLMVTAGHCAKIKECKDVAFILNYKVNEMGSVSSTYSSEDVYFCNEILAREETEKKQDYNLLRLDRKVKNARPLRLRQGPLPAIGTELFVIGFPSGLPMKFSDAAQVRGYEGGDTCFLADLDAFGGNSGSPVFNANTLEVEGVLVRGDEDYVKRKTCKAYRHCEQDGCEGEASTDIEFINQALLKL